MSAEDNMRETFSAAFEESTTPKDKLRNHLLSLGYNGILSLGRCFRRQDDDDSQTLTTEEMAEGIKSMGLEMEDEEFSDLFAQCDVDGSGTIKYDEFLCYVAPPMSEPRIKVVDQAFDTLDESGDGHIALDDLKAKYNVSQHPSVLDESESEDDVLNRYIERYQNATAVDGIVTRKEFMDYYSGVSASFVGEEQDECFCLMMRNAFNLPPE